MSATPHRPEPESPFPEFLPTGVIAAIPDAVVVADDGGRIVLTNPRVAEVFGWSDHDLIGQPVEVLMPKRYRAFHPHRRSGYEGHRMDLLELRGCRRDGSEFPAEISLASITHEGRSFVCATVRDITERKRSEERFRQLVDAAPDPLVIVDGEGAIVHSNQQVSAVFGWSTDELVGRPVEVLVPSRYRSRHHLLRTEFTRAPRTRPMGTGRELYAVHRDGTEFPVEVSLSPIQTEDATLLCASIRDLTERHRVQHQIDQAREDLLAAVSHEMRTPLTSILGYLEVLLDLDGAGPVEASARAMLEVVRSNAQRELRLVNDLLAVAAVGEEGPTEEHVELPGLVQGAVAAAASAAVERGVHVSVGVAPDVPPVIGRAHRLRQAIDHLLANAIKFCHPGGHVEVAVRFVDQRVCVAVTDNGIGIADEEHAVIFERLYRSPIAVEACIPGTGVGLSLVRAIAQAHGGRVEVTSRLGVGSSFRLLLPPAGPVGRPARPGPTT